MTIPKAQDRLEVLARIEEYEKKGLFDHDTEINPPWVQLNPDRVDYFKKKLSSKIKAWLANLAGKMFFNALMRKKKVIFSGVKGLENLDGFTGGAIVTCNHCHMFDNYAAYLGIKQYFTHRSFNLYKVVREGNYSFPGIVGFFMRNCHTLPVNERGNSNHRLTTETMKAVQVLLERGEKVLVYAEQGMWWNYRKPRPLKKGAFLFATKANAPIIPCFLTMKDSDIIGEDGFPVQEFTFNILPILYPDKNMSLSENCESMRAKNFELWKDLYETTYGVPLTYLTETATDSGDQTSVDA